MTNRLAQETSPYLQQHADNPVDWYAWNEDTLRLARELGKPILLSVGYSACHWCHVMAHESFEDADVAGLPDAPNKTLSEFASAWLCQGTHCLQPITELEELLKQLG